jgi:putative addiction module component (TIGR02574 family)
MNDETKTLSRKARTLSPNERVALVEDVLESLDTADPETDKLWAREAADRLAAYRRGDLSAKDISEIAAKYRP